MKWSFIVKCTTIIALSLFLSGSALAGPGLISYQGKLTDNTGTPIEGAQNMTFRLYDNAVGGSELWYETQNGVVVTGGIYDVRLGAVVALDESMFEGNTVYLQVEIYNGSTWEALAPRQQLTSTAYAFKAGKADLSANAEDAETLDGLDSSAFLSSSNDYGRSGVAAMLYEGASSLSSLYVNEGQGNSITSSMIIDSSIMAADLADNSVGVGEISAGAVGTSEILDGSVSSADLQDGAALAEIADDDGPGSGLNADFLDGLDSTAFLSTTTDFGRSGVAATLYEGASSLSSLYVNEGQISSISSAMILDSTVMAADLAADSVGASEIAANSVGASEIADNSVGSVEIAWSISDTAADLNGGLLHLTNSSNSDSGNYPMGIAGQASGTSVGNPVIGVFGGAPGLGLGAPVGNFPENTKIGVGGASDTGHGVAGVSTSGYGMYAYSGSSYGVYAYSPGSYAVYGYGYIRGLYGYATYQYGSGAYGYATGANSYGMYGYSSGTSGYGGYFNASGTSGTGIYATGGSSGKAAIFRGNVQIQRESDGTTIMELGAGLDYAEGFDVSKDDEVEPGAVLVIDPDNPGKLVLSSKSYDTKVAGIVAGANNLGSGVRLGAGEFDHDVALAGRVYCNVDASQGGVKPGDLLTTSATPGHAMKVKDHSRSQGAILGKAMESMEKGEKGQILVLVTLQ